MSDYAMLYPMFVLVALTAFVFARLGMKRAHAVKKGEMDGRFFKAYQGFDEPDHLRIWSRHAINLTELPVLFYLGAITTYVTGQTSFLLVVLAWLYVFLRLVHSYIHLGANKVIKRFQVYAVSFVVLVAIWFVLLLKLLLES